ncbi:hypothetical protein JIY74_31185 [Vibrio harveyi]|nr:hypothetical protein [Vibrio harveyi]
MNKKIESDLLKIYEISQQEKELKKLKRKLLDSLDEKFKFSDFQFYGFSGCLDNLIKDLLEDDFSKKYQKDYKESFYSIIKKAIYTEYLYICFSTNQSIRTDISELEKEISKLFDNSLSKIVEQIKSTIEQIKKLKI